MVQPLYRNLAAALVTVVYVKCIIGCCDVLVRRRVLSSDVSRKLVHIAAGCWCGWWPLFDATHWSWRLNILVPAVFSVQLLYKGLVLKDPDDPDVRTMSRSGDPFELCLGPLFFTLVMSAVGLALFRTAAGVCVMAALGFGDGLAPVVGQRVPVGRYRCPGGVKTLSGSAAMFGGSIVGVVVLRAAIGKPDMLVWPKLIGLAASATITEALSPRDADNFLIPLAVLLTTKLIGTH